MNGDEKIRPDGELAPQSDFGKKLDNFWFYNKWKVLAAIFILFIVVVCVVQIAVRDRTDVKVVCAAALRPTDELVPAMAEALSSVEPEEVGKNGVGFTVLDVYSEEDLTALNAKIEAAKASGDETLLKNLRSEYNYRTAATSSNYENFCQLITAGEYSVLLVDRWVYDKIKGNVGFRAVSDVTDAVADTAKYDECAVYFKKTAFYGAHLGTFSNLDDEVLVCLCIYSPYKMAVGCGGSPDRDYEKSVELFKTLTETAK